MSRILCPGVQTDNPAGQALGPVSRKMVIHFRFKGAVQEILQHEVEVPVLAEEGLRNCSLAFAVIASVSSSVMSPSILLSKDLLKEVFAN